jgi:hypothetical protein
VGKKDIRFIAILGEPLRAGPIRLSIVAVCGEFLSLFFRLKCLNSEFLGLCILIDQIAWTVTIDCCFLSSITFVMA